MTFIDPLLSHPLVPRVGWALLHFIWQGAAIAALLGILLFLLQRRSANTRYLTACTALLLMAAALPLTMTLVPGDVPITSATVRGSAMLVPPPMTSEPPSLPMPEPWSPGPLAESHVLTPTLVSEMPSQPAIPWYRRAARDIDPLLPWAVLLWLGGVCALSVRLAVGWVVVQRLRKRFVRPVAEATQALLERLARRLAVSRPVRAVESAVAEVPSVIGWLRPVILLPASALTGLTPGQLEAVIAHELAHIRRYDYLANLVQSVIETILFYHPAVWWVSRRIRMEREHCCDDIAVAVCGDARAYARALSEMESLRSPRLAAAVVGGDSLLERIRRLVGPRTSVHTQYGRFTAGLLVTAAVLAFVVLVQFSSPDAVAGDKSDVKPTTDIATTTQPAGEVDETVAATMNQPKRWRHFVKLVVGTNAMTFQGKLTSWDALPEVLVQVPNRGETVLELAFNDAEAETVLLYETGPKISALAQSHGFEYLSLVGIHPLGAKAQESMFLPVPTQRGRWRHHVRLVVRRKDQAWATSFQGVDMGYGTDAWVRPASEVPQRRWTVLEVAAAPNSLTPQEYQSLFEKIRDGWAAREFEKVIDVGVKPSDSKGSESVFLADLDQPGRWRHSVLVVIDERQVTFEGRPVDKNLEVLKDVPDREHTVLEYAFAVEPPEEARRRIEQDIFKLATELGFEGTSFVGIKPLGTKSGPSTFQPSVEPPTTQPAAIPSTGAPVSPQGDAAVRAELTKLKLGLAFEHQKQMQALNQRENPAVSGPRMAGVQLATAQCYREYYGQFGFDPAIPFPRHAEDYEALRGRWEKAEGEQARAAVVKELLAQADRWIAEAEANVEKAKEESKLPPSTAQAAVEAGKTAFLAGKMTNYPLPHVPGRIEPDQFCLEFLRKHAPKVPDIATIAGTVLDGSGEPAADVTVYITTAAEDRKPVIVKTDKTGAFSSQPLPPGRYSVSAFRNVMPEGKNWKGQPGHVMGYQEPVEVKEGQGSIIQLRPAGKESIAVTLAQPGPHHLEWGVIFVARSPIDMDDTVEPAGLKLPPDLLGFFVVKPGTTVLIHGLPTGTVHVLATPSDPGPMGFSESTPVDIKPGQTSTVRLALKPREAARRPTTAPAGGIAVEKLEPVRQARAAVQSYINAALAGRDAEAAKLADPGSAAGRQVKDIRELGGPIEIENAYADSAAALVVTSVVKEDRGQAGRLVFSVVKSADHWLIRDIDFEDDEGLKTETERFFGQHPEARPRERMDADAQGQQAPVLAFRVAPNEAGSNRVPSLDASRNYTAELEENGYGPDAGRKRSDPFQWFEMAEQAEKSPNAITATWQGRRYMLLCARDVALQDGVHPTVMNQGDKDKPAWNLKRVYATTQSITERPAIGFELDEEGGRQLKALTAANLNHHLAILLDGKVLSSSIIRSEIGSNGMISGSFTQSQVDQIVESLKNTIPAPAQTQPSTDQSRLNERTEALSSQPAPENSVSRLPANPSSRPAPGGGVGGPAGVVLLPDGKPAADATVVLVRPAPVQYASAAQFLNGRIQSAGGSLTVQTAPDGRFSFAEQEEHFRIIVLHDAGYGESTMEPASFEKITLEQWGRIEGRLAIAGTEGRREKIILDNIRDFVQDNGLLISHRCETQTDERSRFVLDHVVPRYVVVGHEVTVAKAKSMTMALDHGVGVDVKPGTTVRVTIGGTGRRVTGKLIAGEDVKVDFRRAFASAYLMPNAPLPVPPSETEDRMAWYEKWAASDEGKAHQRATNTRYLALVNDDGTFSVEDLPPDEYRIMVMIHKINEGPSWGPGEPIAVFNDVVVVEDGPRDEPFVLEDLELVPQTTSMAPAAKTVFVNTTTVEPFAIYLVVEPAETRHAEGVPLEALKLDSRPLITAKDIVEYDWDTHTIKLSEAAQERLPTKIPVQGVPFVVVVNGERCYLGAFWTVISSYMPKVPLIYSPKEIGQPADTIRIQAPPIQGTPDLRNDDRTKKVLDAAGRLKRENATIELSKPLPVAGRILDRDGQPIAGARVVLYHNLSLWGLDNRVVEETQSAADGAYVFKTPLQFERPIPHAYAQDTFIIFVTHPQHALGWLNVKPGEQRPDYTVRLTEPETKTVRVVDADDKPLEGVRVWVYNAGDPQGKDVLLRDYFHIPTDAGVTGATTNAGGEATVTNLPKTRCSFHAKLPGYAEGIAFHAGQTIRLSKGGTVTGRVLTTDDKPVAEAIVRFGAAWSYNFYALVRTDEQGRYRIEDLPAAGWDMSAWGSPPGSGTYNVMIHHDDYMTPTFDVAVEPGAIVEDMDIEALPGTLVVCKVVQPETNRPLAGVRLMGHNDQDRINGYTDANGTFKVRVLGGRTWIEFQSPPDNMYAVEPEGGRATPSRAEFDAEGEQMEVTITAPAGMGFIISALGTVVDPDGKPVTGARVWAVPAASLQGATGPSCTPETATDAEGRFELAKAPADTDLCIYVETLDRTLAGTGVFEIGDKPDNTAPIRIQLRPTASVDVILRDPKRGNEPVRDTTLQIWPRVGEQNMWRTDRGARTDADGRLRIDGILPRLEYSVRDAVYDSLDRAPFDANNPPYQDRLQLAEASSE